MPPRPRWRALLAALLAATLLLPAAPAALAVVPPTPPAAPTGAAVTLVTGDRVVLSDAGGRQIANVVPAERGGRQVAFTSFGAEGHLYVVPSDVAGLVGGLLDPALFDVTALARDGWNDSEAGGLRLIVERAPGAAATRQAGPLRVTRELESIGAVAATLPAERAAELGAALAARQRGGAALAAGPLAGVERLWLDRRVEAASLDFNLRQVEAPRAWRSGLSGAGVRLAVLDTGIDATHPDLAGKVVAEANFSSSDSTADRVGHGTHVAAIAAGSGAGSAERRGVAFGADLLNGKVLGDNGFGQTSWVIDGLEWAVEQAADVVNLSLSSNTASDGTDPVSQAVNRLTAASGTLFVAASGNTWPTSAVNAPAAADAALAVGAVDARDRMAPFSAQGPRPGDLAIKPDITAPGVGIVAARAAGTALDEPIDARYVRASGTSMAAPHVAGAAALLAERHPEWEAARLKATLVGSADPQRGTSVYEGGGGRLDAATALAQRLASDRSSVDFGSLAFPQGSEPLARTVTLTNAAEHATWVRLDTELEGPDGPAPRRMVSVTPERVHLPAGGSATVSVSLRAGLGDPGRYSGALVADPAGGPDLRLPLGAVKQPRRHTLHVRVVDRRGNPAQRELVQVLNVDSIERSPVGISPAIVRLDANGEADVAVVPGHYSVMSNVATRDERGFIESFAIAGDPELTVAGDLSVTVDARAAVPVSAELEGRDATLIDISIGQTRTDVSGEPIIHGQMSVSIGGVDDQDRLFVEPGGPVRTGRLEARSYWRFLAPDGREVVSALFTGDGWERDERHVVSAAAVARAATVEVDYHTIGAGIYMEGTTFFSPLRAAAIGRVVPFAAPVHRTERFVADPDVVWQQCLLKFHPFGFPMAQWCDRQRVPHPPGERETRSWLRGPLLPRLEALRNGDSLAFRMDELLDEPSHEQLVFGLGVRAASYRVLRDGEVLLEGVPTPNRRVGVPGHGRTWFRLERTLSFDPAGFDRPHTARSAWTFSTVGPGRGSSVPPLLNADVRVGVDLRNQVPAGGPLPIEVAVAHPEGAPPVPIREARLWTSTDGGASWTEAALAPLGGGRFRATLAPPAAGTTLSLRLDASDWLGNRVEQEVVDALGVA